MHTKVAGKDNRLLYFTQSMWHDGEATSPALFHIAVTNGKGIVAPDELTASMGMPDWNPKLPECVQAWIEAEGQRVWPSEI
ncbi:MAG: hypothetical protein ABGW81_04535 [Paracoccaceae bacterium]